MKHQSITDLLLANSWVLDEYYGYFTKESEKHSFIHISFNYIAEMANKHTVEEFTEIAVEKGWVTEVKPEVKPQIKEKEKKEITTEDIQEKKIVAIRINTDSICYTAHEYIAPDIILIKNLLS